MLSGAVGTEAFAAPAPPCQSVVRLSNADDGHRLRVCRGTRIEVVLRAPLSDAPDTWWQPVMAGGRALHAVPNGKGTAMRGVTLGSFVAGRTGTSGLRSRRVACPVNPSGPPCHPFARWHVTVRVA